MAKDKQPADVLRPASTKSKVLLEHTKQVLEATRSALRETVAMDDLLTLTSDEPPDLHRTIEKLLKTLESAAEIAVTAYDIALEGDSGKK